VGLQQPELEGRVASGRLGSQGLQQRLGPGIVAACRGASRPQDDQWLVTWVRRGGLFHLAVLPRTPGPLGRRARGRRTAGGLFPRKGKPQASGDGDADEGDAPETACHGPFGEYS
jgi:hypothetical protein